MNNFSIYYCPAPDSPQEVVDALTVPSSGQSLQISPNLEALLKHDELTRRAALESPTFQDHQTSDSFVSAIGLPPPPPRTHHSRKPMSRDKKPGNIAPSSGHWPDGFSARAATPDVPSNRPSPVQSRTATPTPLATPTSLATPNPYINPAPLQPVLHTDICSTDEGRTNYDTAVSYPTHSSSSEAVRPREECIPACSSKAPDDLRGSPSPDLQLCSQRSNPTLAKVEKILGKGKGLFPVPSNCKETKTKIEQVPPRNHSRPQPGAKVVDLTASSSSDVRQMQVVREKSRAVFGINHTASDSSRSVTTQFSGQPSSARLEVVKSLEPHLHRSRSESLRPTYLSSGTDILVSSNLPTSSKQELFPNYLTSDAGLVSQPSTSLSDRESFMELCSPGLADYEPMQFRPGSPSEESLRHISTRQRSQLSPIEYSSIYSNYSAHSSSTTLPDMVFAPASPLAVDKPPIPISPKPKFTRLQLQTQVKRTLQNVSPSPRTPCLSILPPTTNLLEASERAGLIRRNRKLARMFGQTPNADALAQEREGVKLKRPLPQPPGNHRHAMSAYSHSGMLSPVTPWQILEVPVSDGRRHSSPLYASSFPVESNLGWRSPYGTSFIDLSDEEVSIDDVTAMITMVTPKWADKRQPYPYSPSTPSLTDGMPPEQLAEWERRRKRDKIAKLHRFLGSRVPTDLVLGPSVLSPSLPSPPRTPQPQEESHSRPWVKHQRRSSSAGASPMGSNTDLLERRREELGDAEKALNVRRAHKMEKVFGTPAPPQTLYHTRSSPQVNPTTVAIPFIPPSDVPSSPQRNPNQSAYTKLKGSRHRRPGTPDSTQNLLPARGSSDQESPTSNYMDVLARSSVYMNYQYSLNSLTDIINRDDRESLAELHRYLHGEHLDSLIDRPLLEARPTSMSSSKSERRHSLPTQTSRTSLSSEFTLPNVKPEPSDFQLRRRRAAKLTNFFGVNYNELIHDVLESIEKGVDEEGKRGTLQPEEVEVLLHKLRTLKTKRTGLLF